MRWLDGQSKHYEQYKLSRALAPPPTCTQKARDFWLLGRYSKHWKGRMFALDRRTGFTWMPHVTTGPVWPYLSLTWLGIRLQYHRYYKS